MKIRTSPDDIRLRKEFQILEWSSNIICVTLQDLHHVLIYLGLVNVDSFLMTCRILNQWVYLLSCFECGAFCLGSWKRA